MQYWVVSFRDVGAITIVTRYQRVCSAITIVTRLQRDCSTIAAQLRRVYVDEAQPESGHDYHIIVYLFTTQHLVKYLFWV